MGNNQIHITTMSPLSFLLSTMFSARYFRDPRRLIRSPRVTNSMVGALFVVSIPLNKHHPRQYLRLLFLFLFALLVGCSALRNGESLFCGRICASGLPRIRLASHERPIYIIYHMAGGQGCVGSSVLRSARFCS